MTIRPATLKRRQPGVGSLPIVTIVMPAIPPKGQRTSLGAKQAYRPYPSSAEWMEKGRTGVGPIVAGVSVAAPTKAFYFRRLGGPANHDAPHWPGRFLSNLRLSQWSKFTS